MAFEFGLFDFLLAPLLLIGVPIAVIVLARRAITRYSGLRSSHADEQTRQQLHDELHAASLRIEELESQLTRVEQRARFTEALLDKRPE
jgi:hypothetical protein